MIQDLTPLPPAEQLALDAAVFQAVEAGRGGEVLRVWESDRTAVIVGHSGVADREVREEACAGDGVPVLRRTSGGGAVVVGRGCLNYALVLSLEARPELRDVATSYALILGRLVAALDAPGLAVRGTSDLALGDRKVGGSAQRRGRRALLHHGTILYDFDAALMERFLKDPARQPAYRAGRGHSAFVDNLPIPRALIQARLAGAWPVMPHSA
jgi:lipoate-protein ligase A